MSESQTPETSPPPPDGQYGRSDVRLNSASAIAPYTDSPDDAIQYVTQNGTDWLVAPVIAIQEGVYEYPSPDGDGIDRQYLPGQAIANTAPSWDGRSLLLDHPLRPDGRPTVIMNDDATDESVVEIGQYRAAETARAADGRTQLRGEAWFDRSEAGNHGGAVDAILNALENDDYVETSTGYLSAVEHQSGTFNGEPYDAIQRHLQPDHLAVFDAESDKRGNCSVEAGCGIGRLNRQYRSRPDASAGDAGGDPDANTATNDYSQFDSNTTMHLVPLANARSTARDPEYNGTPYEGEWERPDLQSYASAAYNRTDAEKPDDIPGDVDDLPRQVKSWIANRSLLGDPDATSYRDLAMFPVVAPNNQLSEDALDSVLSTIGTADISEDTANSVQNKAQQLLEEEYDRDFSDSENEAKPDESKTNAGDGDGGDGEDATATVNDDDASALGHRLLSALGLGGEPSTATNEAIDDAVDDGIEKANRRHRRRSTDSHTHNDECDCGESDDDPTTNSTMSNDADPDLMDALTADDNVPFSDPVLNQMNEDERRAVYDDYCNDETTADGDDGDADGDNDGGDDNADDATGQSHGGMTDEDVDALLEQKFDDYLEEHLPDKLDHLAESDLKQAASEEVAANSEIDPEAVQITNAEEARKILNEADNTAAGQTQSQQPTANMGAIPAGQVTRANEEPDFEEDLTRSYDEYEKQ